nr:MAG TPA: hypothetical protein [Caudoviricetes sp.]
MVVVVWNNALNSVTNFPITKSDWRCGNGQKTNAIK